MCFINTFCYNRPFENIYDVHMAQNKIGFVFCRSRSSLILLLFRFPTRVPHFCSCHFKSSVPKTRPALIGQLVNSKCERQKVHSFMLFCTCACWLSVKNTQKPNFPGGTVNTVNRNQMLTKITNDGVMTNILIDKFLKKYVRHPETTRRSERKWKLLWHQPQIVQDFAQIVWWMAKGQLTLADGSHSNNKW